MSPSEKEKVLILRTRQVYFTKREGSQEKGSRETLEQFNENWEKKDKESERGLEPWGRGREYGGVRIKLAERKKKWSMNVV